MGQREVLDKIQDAEMILVGLGEEFDNTRIFRDEEVYRQDEEVLQDSEYSFLIPLAQRYYRAEPERQEAENRLEKGLDNLVKALADKNYFVVTTSVNGKIAEKPWREGRIVMPCGSENRIQCPDGCAGGIGILSEQEQEKMEKRLPELIRGIATGGQINLGLGVCPECGKPLQLNNVYHQRYDEKGYLEDWQRYMKWLQGTLNRKLLVLELGVGMQFPSVVRWAFEKAAFFNQKAYFYRIHENLYQLTEELAGKGTGIAENVIDWLQDLC